jgi:UDP-glucose 4-epimerase
MLMKDASILVTGGSGFIGSHIARELVVDNDVTVLDIRPAEAPSGVSVVEGDVRDLKTVEEAVSGMDVVFHEAGLVSVAASVENPKESHTVNAEGTLNVLEAARKHDTRVVFASSAAVYGFPEEVPISETDPVEPTSPYGLDKLVGDQYMRLYEDLYGVETVSLRYFNVYGPGQTGGDYAGVIDVFLEQARNGEAITVHGDGTQTRDFVHVADVVEANLLAAETDAVGKAFNIGTGSSVTIRKLAELIRDVVDSDSDIVHVDPREGDINQSCADISRAREELGYTPTIELPEGLESLLK